MLTNIDQWTDLVIKSVLKYFDLKFLWYDNE